MQTFKPSYQPFARLISSIQVLGKQAGNGVADAGSYAASGLFGFWLRGQKYRDPGEFLFHQLLDLSRFVSGYGRILEELDDPHFELKLDDFRGDF